MTEHAGKFEVAIVCSDREHAALIELLLGMDERLHPRDIGASIGDVGAPGIEPAAFVVVAGRDHGEGAVAAIRDRWPTVGIVLVTSWETARPRQAVQRVLLMPVQGEALSQAVLEVIAGR